MPDVWQVCCDGGCPIPRGPGAWAFVVKEEGRTLYSRSGFLPSATNNEAEYRAITAAAIILCAKSCEGEIKLPELVEFWGDSQLVAYQLTGRYSVNQPHLRPLYEEAQQAMRFLRQRTKVTINWFRRENNTEADELCNQVFDRRGIALKKVRIK